MQNRILHNFMKVLSLENYWLYSNYNNAIVHCSALFKLRETFETGSIQNCGLLDAL